MFEFAWPWMFALLPLPFLVWWLVPPYRARQASVQVPFFDRLAAATGQTPQQGAVVRRRRASQMIVAILVWILIVVALAWPQWVGDPLTHEISARDLILAVDISGSMDQADFRAADGQMLTRLDGVKRVIEDFISRRHGDRVALILFGTRAYVQVPFTQDLQTAQELLEQTQVGMAGQQTAIGDTIGLAIKTLEKSTAKQKLLILLTDGNDTASRVPPEHAADIAHQNGVVVYTIGVGDPTASPHRQPRPPPAASRTSCSSWATTSAGSMSAPTTWGSWAIARPTSTGSEERVRSSPTGTASRAVLQDAPPSSLARHRSAPASPKSACPVLNWASGRSIPASPTCSRLTAMPQASLARTISATATSICRPRTVSTSSSAISITSTPRRSRRTLTIRRTRSSAKDLGRAACCIPLPTARSRTPVRSPPSAWRRSIPSSSPPRRISSTASTGPTSRGSATSTRPECTFSRI